MIDDTNALLSVPITNFSVSDDIPPVLVIGGKVYGYSDAPIDRDCKPSAGACVLSVALPKDLLTANPVISVKTLMLDEDGIQSKLAVNRTFPVFQQSSPPEKLVLLSHDKNTATYLLWGHSLNDAKVLWPTGNADPKCPKKQLCLQPLSATADDGAMRLLKMPVDLVKDSISVVLQRSGTSERPFVLSVPAVPSDADASANASAANSSAPKFQERLVVGADEGTIVGDKLNSIVSANFGGKPLAISQKTPTTLTITGLAAAGATAVAKTQQVVLVNQAGTSTNVPLEVVSSKVEVLSK